MLCCYCHQCHDIVIAIVAHEITLDSISSDGQDVFIFSYIIFMYRTIIVIAQLMWNRPICAPPQTLMQAVCITRHFQVCTWILVLLLLFGQNYQRLRGIWSMLAMNFPIQSHLGKNLSQVHVRTYSVKGAKLALLKQCVCRF